MKNDEKHLYNLDELSDYKVASDDPDVRGWDVRDANNQVIGKVDNLLVNKQQQRVVYLDVQVDKTIIDAKHDPYGAPENNDVREFINKDGENHIILPIGMVSLNKDKNFVSSNVVDHRTFSETKRYKQGAPLNREYEVAVLNSLNRENEDVYNDENFYERKEFERW